MRVLVIEDNEIVARTVAQGLRDHGVAVDVAGDGAAGLRKAALASYDVIVLDRDLPVVHGDDVCAELAGHRDRPRILMLTAAGAPDENTDPFTNVVSVTIMRLRRKLGDPPLIETIIGGGYRLP